jgi:hypothetical protein
VHLPKYTLKGIQSKKQKSLFIGERFFPFSLSSSPFSPFPFAFGTNYIREGQGDKPNPVQTTEKALAFSSVKGSLFCSCLGVWQAIRVAFRYRECTVLVLRWWSL